MNLLTTAVQTMTSREIADLCGKRHDNVMRVCRELKAEGVCPQIEECSVINELAGGRSFTEFRLNKRDSLVLVARLSPEFTAAIVDRWQELERVASQTLTLPDFTNPAEAARAWAAQYEEKVLLAAEVEAARPAVEFKERYVDSSSGAKGFREVCKLLKAKEPAFREFLTEKKIMYRIGGALTPYAEHLDAGRFEVKAGTSETNGHAYNTARFTPKGIAWVAGLWAAHQIEQVPA